PCAQSPHSLPTRPPGSGVKYAGRRPCFCDSMRDCPALHSLPTRRSSDLGIDTLQKLSTYTEKEILKIHGIGRASIPTMRKLLEEDRKSTRLNSSHVKISYAVFCLKKTSRATASR